MSQDRFDLFFLSFLCGAVLASFAGAFLNSDFIFLPVIVLPMTAFVLLFRQEVIKFFALGFVLSLIWSSFYGFLWEKQQKQIRELANRQTRFEATVVGIASVGKNYFQIPIEIDGIKLLLFTDKRFSFGDVIEIEGEPSFPKRFLNKQTNKEFNYEEFLKGRGYHGIFRFPHIELLAKGGGAKVFLISKIENTVFNFREKVSDKLYAYTAPVALGMTIGDKAQIDEKVKANLVKSGLVHLVVLSGGNIVALIGFLFVLFRYIFNYSFAVFATLVLVAVFVFAVGADAPAVRAGIMGVISLLAIFNFAQVNLGRSLLFAVFVMSVFNPFIWLDVSFQFTLIATVAVVFGTPILSMFFWYLPTVLKEVISATVAVQTALFPLLAYKMGVISLVAPLANIFAVPLAPAVMFSTFAISIPPISQPASFISNTLVEFIIAVAELFANIPFSVIHFEKFSIYLVFLWWALLIFIWFVLKEPKCEQIQTDRLSTEY